MNITVSALIKTSMLLAGSIQTGEEPTTQEYADCFALVQDTLEVLNINNLLVYSNTSQSVQLVANKAAYTIGKAIVPANIDVERPIAIEQATFKINTLEIAMQIISVEEYNQIAIKSLAAPIPRVLYYDQDFPLSTIRLYPVPSQAGTMILYFNKYMPVPTTITDILSYPPGYSKALKYNLAVEIGAMFGEPVDPRVVEIAQDTLHDVRTANSKTPVLKFDIGSNMGKSTYFNWYTGV